MEIDLPYGSYLEARTSKHPISFSGLGRVDLTTDEGEIELEAPWKATRLTLTTESRPSAVRVPEGIKFDEGYTRNEGTRLWALRDTLLNLA